MRLISNPTKPKPFKIGFTQNGFTLVELIVVIAITGILAAGATKFIANPTQSYFDMESRANLTDRADTALRNMARNIRNALPNSVRVTSGTNSFIEFVPIVTAGRYRASIGSPDTRRPDEALDFSASSGTFDVLGNFYSVCTSCGTPPASATYCSAEYSTCTLPAGISTVWFGSGSSWYSISGAFNSIPCGNAVFGDPLFGSVKECRYVVTSSSIPQLVIFNLGVPGANVYEGTNKRTVTIDTDTTFGDTKISYSGGAFPFASPSSRYYVVSTPITYACDMTTDTTNKKLIMYSGYAIQSSQPVTIATLDGLASVRKSTLAENLSTCSFSYSSGISERTAIVNITLAMTENGANVRLMHQVSVANSP